MSEVSRGGPLPGPRAIWRLPAAIYGSVVAMRNRRFDAGRGVQRLACPVVSIGNLTVGGTGKTPMVAEVARMLQAAGLRPIVALRGYKARRGESDEAELHRRALRGVPIVVGADRLKALRGSGEDLRPPSVVVLDDGFQHRRLHRDFDLVLVDASRPSLDGDLLPAGWLREPSQALRRAHAVVVTRAGLVDPTLASLIERHHGRPAAAWTAHRWDSLAVHRAGREEQVGVEWLHGRRVATLAGIGHPDSFRAMVRDAGGAEVASLQASDHQHYDGPHARRLAGSARAAGAESVVTTEKDWVKLVKVWSDDMPLVVPRLRLKWICGEQELRRRLLQSIRGGGPEMAASGSGETAHPS